MAQALEQIMAETPAHADDDKAPVRRCIVTGALRPKAELVRFVVAPDGRVVPDINESLPGRGLWLTASRDIVAAASGKGLFAKAARTEATAPADLADQVEGLLARRCCDLLGFARRAGQAAAGFEKVRAWLVAGKAGVLVTASDAAEDGRRKLQALAPETPIVALLRGDELSPALGRENAVHVAVGRGKLAALLLQEAKRLSGFRGGPEAPGGIVKFKRAANDRGRKQRVHGE